MYNRYIPGTNGIYERKTVQEPTISTQGPHKEITAEIDTCRKITEENRCCNKKLLPSGIDIGDILVLCIILLLLLDSDEDDIVPLLITAVVFLFF